ncbi:MAG: hypothetical protein KME17_24145 [Cyanosarcina radialis HA8281-LM2]|nr:hypothetical protein [Cyanosarcina radialis HA8281-LM2]
MIRNNRKFSLASFLLLIPTVGVMALPSVASAEVRQVLPGTICQLHGQALTDSSLAGQESLSYSQHGAVINNHPTKYLYVVCPITRFSNYRATIRVYYAAQNLAQPLRCRVNSNYPFGTTAYHTTAWATLPNNNPWWFHQVPQYNWSSGLSSGITTYTVFCQIPPSGGGNKSSVGSIIVND